MGKMSAGKILAGPTIAIMNVLEKKGILTKEEIREELDKLNDEQKEDVEIEIQLDGKELASQMRLKGVRS